MRTIKEITEDLTRTSKMYKGLTPGSVRFRAVSKSLQEYDKELQERLKNDLE